MHALRPVRAVVLGASIAAAVAFVPVATTAAHAADPPTVTGVSPSTGPAAGGTSVTVTGTGFTGETAVEFGGTPATSVTNVTDTSLTAVSPAGDDDRTVDVTVTGPDGTSQETDADEFTYDDVFVTGVSPKVGYASGGTRVTITGSGFEPGDEDVYFIQPYTGPQSGRAPYDRGARILSESSTQIVVASPEGIAGAADIQVETDDNGNSPLTSADRFTYLATVPVIAVRGTRTGALYVSANQGPFVSYGGSLKGAPAVVSENDRNYYFVRAVDNDLYVRTDRTGFTELRPGNPLNCATPPAAFSEPGDEFAVACIGRNTHLYTAVGTLPSTGNPTISDLVESQTSGYNDDYTKLPGGVGVDNDGDFLVTGPTYAATASSSPSQNGPDLHPSGNVYGFYVLGELEVYAHAESDDVQEYGGACGGAPSGTYAGEVGGVGGDTDYYYITCRRTTSAATVSLEETYNESDQGTTFSTFTSTVGGVIVGSPATQADTTTDGVDVVATGTNGRIYEAKVADNHTTTGYALSPIAANANSGPGLSAGPPPANTGAARNGFARLRR